MSLALLAAPYRFRLPFVPLLAQPGCLSNGAGLILHECMHVVAPINDLVRGGVL